MGACVQAGLAYLRGDFASTARSADIALRTGSLVGGDSTEGSQEVQMFMIRRESGDQKVRRVRGRHTDRIDQAGVITLRVAGRLHHIGVGRTYTGTRVLVLVQDLNIRIIHAATGELLRQLTLDTTKDYQPTGVKCGSSPENRITV